MGFRVLIKKLVFINLITDLEVKKQERRERRRREKRAQQFNGQIEQLKHNISELKTTVEDLQKRKKKERSKPKPEERTNVIVIPVYYCVVFNAVKTQIFP